MLLKLIEDCGEDLRFALVQFVQSYNPLGIMPNLD